MELKKSKLPNETQGLLKKIHEQCVEVFALYNTTVRTPANWREERERIIGNTKSRANWEYRVPDLTPLVHQIQALGRQLAEQTFLSEQFYDRYARSVAETSLHTARTKLTILADLQSKQFRSAAGLRQQFFKLPFIFDTAVQAFTDATRRKNIVAEGRAFSAASIPAVEAKKIIENAIKKVKHELTNIFQFPTEIQNKLQTFTAEVILTEDPSFLMRCTTDPNTGVISVLLSSKRIYSEALLRIGFLHEFCGHGLESFIFDQTFIPTGICPTIYAYGGVSTPNPFDVKAEVFADRIIEPFLSKNEKGLFGFRKHVWIPVRAMADYTYHIQGGTIADVITLYQQVGLDEFAIDEAIMTSLFICGMQGSYFFANRLIDELQKNYKLSDEQMLQALLFIGKIPPTALSKTEFIKTLNFAPTR